jgi:hypothetical protein
MTQTTSSPSPVNQVSLGKRLVVGAGIGLTLISLFLLPVGDADPAWGKFWMIRPLIVVPLAGAAGGFCNYVLVRFHDRIGVNKAIAWIISVIVFIVGLWMGIVLGLNGTLWD